MIIRFGNTVTMLHCHTFVLRHFTFFNNFVVVIGCMNATVCFLIHFQLTYPPVVRQSAWVQPITIIADQTTHPDVIYQRGLPHLKSVIATTTQTFTNSPSGTPPLPRPPPTTRSRPLSAGAPRRQLTERIAQVPMQKCED